MSLNIGEQIIPQVILGVNNLNKIMLGTIEIFPNLVPEPPGPTPIVLVSSQPDARVNQSATSIPLDTTGLQVGDTVFLLCRSSLAVAIIWTVNGITLTSRLFRGISASISIQSFVVPAGTPDTGIIFLTTSSSATELFASFFIVRGGMPTGLDVSAGSLSAVNTTGITVTPTITDRQMVLVGIATGNSPSPTTVTSLTSTSAQEDALALPRLGMAGFICIVDTPIPNILTSAPVGNGQFLGGVWMTYTP